MHPFSQYVTMRLAAFQNPHPNQLPPAIVEVVVVELLLVETLVWTGSDMTDPATIETAKNNVRDAYESAMRAVLGPWPSTVTNHVAIHGGREAIPTIIDVADQARKLLERIPTIVPAKKPD